ncbi:MAG: type III PLP-dependent enzyme [Chloroflexota bacterium]
MTAISIRQSVYDRACLLAAQTPFLAVDADQVIQSYYELLSSVPHAEIFYAVKANSHTEIVGDLARAGASFDVASQPELEKVLDLGVTPDRIICSNPIKNARLLARCAELGIFATVADSVDEIYKIARYAPGTRVYIRLSVDNSGSIVPLNHKFGVSADEALKLLVLAREVGLQPIGLSFHVGSQCVKAANWGRAIQECGKIWHAAAAQGIDLYFLDLGGGFPIITDPTVASWDEIGQTISTAIDTYLPPTEALRVILEPGRAMVGAAGVMMTTIVGKAQRGDKTWLYLDVGVFNGLMEVLEGFSYKVKAVDVESEPTVLYTLAGPSCDSYDTIMRDVLLPEMQIGDRLCFFNAGAYTTEYASSFNGFDVPTVQILK